MKYQGLQTVKNYAKRSDVTPAYIYKLVKEKRMAAVIIDGVFFIDANKYPSIPTK
jgi:hypothetical protein